ncbi:MAG: prolipoprotein diacylglyceryl transferase family protein [Ginsengibacter sp.]
MYPNLYYAIRDWFGIELNGLKIFYTFGIFVALSFIVGAFFLSKEFKRKEKLGLLAPAEEVITVGKPATFFDLLVSGVIGFSFGFKLLGAFMAMRTEGTDLQEYIFSLNGSWLGGLIAGALLLILKYREKNKQKLPKPEQRVIRIWPHDRVGDIVIIALVFGIIGAKLFDNLENWDRFIKNPLANLLSPSGLTFYGGLICAAIAVSVYAVKKGINFWHLVDVAAPGLMIAYAIGRIGCQVSGDGDWGIYNSAYIADQPGHVVPASPEQFNRKLQANAGYFLEGRVLNPDSTSSAVTDRHYDELSKVPSKSFRGPSFLPVWLFAYTYPHNVNEDGVLLPDCNDKYCRVLPQPVFPTSLYETTVCLLFFLLLWSIRKKIIIPGVLFGIYLMLNGVERFFVELIRVNAVYSLFGYHPTQAELVSVLLFIAGFVIVLIQNSRAKSA